MIDPSTGRFMNGHHWRTPKPHWEESWLRHHYETCKLSAGEIAKLSGCTETNILFWMKKHAIQRRDKISARRLAKMPDRSGSRNPMFGKTGSANPHWRGGLTPLRQSMYASLEWKRIVKRIRARDRVCRLCGASSKSEIHHIIPFRIAPILALEDGNLILLCISCHDKVDHNWKRWKPRLFAILDRKEGQ